ncbi:MAG TPA: outer membrane lipoprotein carrier protein LolA [Terriglobales bacterium]|nr:outer membrane lipoprotein carrier protein LolA [Terriglobales bacterium]
MKPVLAHRMGLIFALLLSAPWRPAASSAVANAPSSAQESDSRTALEKVLDRMDAAAASFRTTQAKFEWDQYQKVIDETDSQKGTVYYRRSGKDIEMMAEIADPPKSVLFNNGKVQVWEPKLNRVTTYEAGKNREAVESFLVLGFGGSGHDLLKSFQLKYLDTEKIDGVESVKLELIPKSERVRNLFGHIWLWIDPARGISVQQQFFDTVSGDYRLAKYSYIEVNQKIPDSVFKFKTRGDTQFIAAPKG